MITSIVKIVKDERAMLDVKSLFTMTIDVPQGMHSDREGKDIDSSERLKQ